MIAVSSELADHEVSNGLIILNVVIGYTIVGWLLGFQPSQLLLAALLGLVFQGGFALLGVLVSSWDLILNPWIESLHLDKWNLFTTKHYSAWLLHEDENLWLRQCVFFGMPSMTSVGAAVLDPLAGTASFFINAVCSVILLVVVWQARNPKSP